MRAGDPTSVHTGARAVVIGGSIGGLTAALLLRDLGFEVDVFERTSTLLASHGGGIVLQPDTVRWFAERSTQNPEALRTSTEFVQYLDPEGGIVHRERRRWTSTSWGTFYRALLADFGTARYHLGEVACGVGQDGERATVRFDGGRSAEAELVVFADGITSVGRSSLDPDARFSYSGYVGWRGTVPERELTGGTRALLGEALSYSIVPHSQITLYPIPGESGPRERLINFVWYRNVPAGAELAELLVDKRGVAGSVSLHPGQVQDRFVDEMRDAAARLFAPSVAEVVRATADPYIQVVSDVRSSRMADGRVALIGDAAAAARPHAAAGTAKAAADAWTLAGALAAGDGDIPAALRKWEPGQLELSARLEARVVEMGERSQFHNTWVPGDPSLRFGLYGPGR